MTDSGLPRQDVELGDTSGPVPSLDDYENWVSAIALGKTLAFLFYSVLTVFVVSGSLTILSEMYNLAVGDIAATAVMIVAEGCVLWLIIKGYAPGSKVQVPQPFSEQQIAIGFNVLGAIAGVLEWDAPIVIFGKVVNGALVLFLAVFFVTKSVLGRRIRYRLLFGLVVPVIHLFNLWPW